MTKLILGNKYLPKNILKPSITNQSFLTAEPNFAQFIPKKTLEPCKCLKK